MPNLEKTLSPIHLSPQQANVRSIADLRRRTIDLVQNMRSLGKQVGSNDVRVMESAILLHASIDKMAKDVARGNTETSNIFKEKLGISLARAEKTNTLLKEIKTDLKKKEGELDKLQLQFEDELQKIQKTIPVKKDIESVVKPLIPPIPKEVHGHTPTDTELKKLIKPLIPAPKTGPKGTPGLKGKATKGLPGLPGASIKGDPGSPDTAKDILMKLATLKSKDFEKVKGLVRLMDRRADDGRTGSVFTGPPHFEEAIGEGLTGTIDGNNKEFTLQRVPLTGSERLYIAGIRMKRVEDYTISGLNVSYLVAPIRDDILLADYRY